MKKLLESIIKRKNPHFKFDPALSLRTIIAFSLSKIVNQLRAFKLLWWGHNPLWIFLGRGVKVFNGTNIRFGKWIQLEDQVYLSALGKKPLVLGNNVRIGAFSRIIISTSFNDLGKGIRIGNNVGLGEFAYLGGAGGLEIGDDCIIGQYLSCHPENHNFDNPNLPIRLQGVNRAPICIKPNCWIGSKVTILAGVTIGANSVVAAGAVVTKSMPPNSLIGGVPAKVLKKLNTQKVEPPIALPLPVS